MLNVVSVDGFRDLFARFMQLWRGGRRGGEKGDGCPLSLSCLSLQALLPVPSEKVACPFADNAAIIPQ